MGDSPPSDPPPPFRCWSISTIPDLKKFVEQINPNDLIYIDFQRRNLVLGRTGSLDIITISVRDIVGVIDVQTLGHAAFLTRTYDAVQFPSGTVTLKKILEDPRVLKFVWDVRNGADVLKADFDVGLDGVTDVQLAEVATRSPSQNSCLGSLDYHVRNDLNLSDEKSKSWDQINDWHQKNVMGQNYVLDKRPLPLGTMDYCTGRVTYIIDLSLAYSRKMTEKVILPEASAEPEADHSYVRGHILKESAKRVREVHAAGYQPSDHDLEPAPCKLLSLVSEMQKPGFVPDMSYKATSDRIRRTPSQTERYRPCYKFYLPTTPGSEDSETGEECRSPRSHGQQSSRSRHANR